MVVSNKEMKVLLNGKPSMQPKDWSIKRNHKHQLLHLRMLLLSMPLLLLSMPLLLLGQLQMHTTNNSSDTRIITGKRLRGSITALGRRLRVPQIRTASTHKA